MAKPQYFFHFPDIDYTTQINKAGVERKIKIKDYFHLMELRDDVAQEATNFYTYSIKNGERPEVIASNEYGDERHYWIILQINSIVDYYNQWPLSQHEFDTYMSSKYPTDKELNAVHHWETVEVRGSSGEVLLQEGIDVDEQYVFTYQPDPDDFVYLTSRPAQVTNYDYEQKLNEEKSEIILLDKKFLYSFENQVIKYTDAIKKEGLDSSLSVAELYR